MALKSRSSGERLDKFVCVEVEGPSPSLRPLGALTRTGPTAARDDAADRTGCVTRADCAWSFYPRTSSFGSRRRDCLDRSSTSSRLHVQNGRAYEAFPTALRGNRYVREARGVRLDPPLFRFPSVPHGADSELRTGRRTVDSQISCELTSGAPDAESYVIRRARSSQQG